MPLHKPKGVWREVWADGIEQVIKPAQQLPDIAHNMTGLWYCRTKKCGEGQVGLTNGTAIMSLDQATISSDHRVEFNLNQPAIYAFDGSAPAQAIYKDNMPDTENAESYTLAFDHDKHGELIMHIPLPDGTIADLGGKEDPHSWFTFTWLEDGHWLRKSKESGTLLPEYDLIRIVDAAGKRTPQYNDVYLVDLAAKVAAAKKRGEAPSDQLRKLLVLVDADSDLGRGGPVPPEGGPKAGEDDPDAVSGRDGADSGKQAEVEAAKSTGEAEKRGGKR